MEVSHNTHGSSSFLELNPVDRTSCPGAVLRPDLKKSLMPEHCYLAILTIHWLNGSCDGSASSRIGPQY
jgi:hypothetical protein